jgi:SAM-dependent methyltransferase
MEARELEERIAAFPGWRYRFEFEGGVRTPVSAHGMVNRHAQRRRYFFEALLGLLGGSLRGHRVLDLGCNAGFWALEALEAGADFVLGVDAQQAYLDQASLVFEAKGVAPARYRFEQGDVFGHVFDEKFDVVLCLGLMDHVARPFELFGLMAGVGAELIVIDTEVSRARASIFELTRLYGTTDVLDHNPQVLIPSRSAMAELAGQFGFETVPLELNVEDYTGMGDYRRHRRLAFICSSTVPVDGLAAAPPLPLFPWWIRDPGALFAPR